jgi:hypothetical protein
MSTANTYITGDAFHGVGATLSPAKSHLLTAQSTVNLHPVEENPTAAADWTYLTVNIAGFKYLTT